MCLLVGTPRTYFRGITSVKEGISNQEMSSDQGGDQSEVSNQKSEIRERSQSAWEHKIIGKIENSERRLLESLQEKTHGHGGPGLCLIVKVIYV
jgi:hypothetical protein